MAFKIALIGNPNCGKTTIFNKLTGSSQYVGNWPGVTVEKKEGFLKGDRNFKIVDLPGIYSLTPYTDEEIVSREFLFKEKPDLILNVVSGVNIERNLFLTLQLIETNIPVFVVVSMMDKVNKKHGTLNFSKLKEILSCEIFENSKKNFKDLPNKIKDNINSLKGKNKAVNNIKYCLEIEKYIEKIENVLDGENLKEEKRLCSVKFLEQDERFIENLFLKEEKILKINEILKEAEKEFEEDTKSEIIKNRYEIIENISSECFKNLKTDLHISDKIDSVLTHKFLSIPIFCFVEFFIYCFCINFLGRPISNFLENFLKETVSPCMKSFLDNLEIVPWLQSLVLDGILSGVGTVLTFVPQVFFLLLFLSLLEDCGYMTRVAFILDRLLLRFGLCGKSVISFLVSSGCGVNGIMATKPIKNEKSRFITILTTTFIPCNAKLPIIFVICSYIFRGSFLTIVLTYFLCIISIFILGFILKKQDKSEKEEADFVMELSPYNIPNLKNALYYTFLNVKAFVIKAGTVIFLTSVLIWFFMNFGFNEGRFGFVSQENSLLCWFGKILTPFFVPIGFGNWQAVVATLSGIFAKENLVNTFGVILKSAQNKDDVLVLKNVFNGDFSSFSFLIFNMLCAPCLAAIATIFKQTRSFRFTFKILFYQTVCAYLVSFLIYQIFGLIFLEVSFSIYTILAFLSLIFILYLIFSPNKSNNKN